MSWSIARRHTSVVAQFSSRRFSVRKRPLVAKTLFQARRFTQSETRMQNLEANVRLDLFHYMFFGMLALSTAMVAIFAYKKDTWPILRKENKTAEIIAKMKEARYGAGTVVSLTHSNESSHNGDAQTAPLIADGSQQTAVAQSEEHSSKFRAVNFLENSQLKESGCETAIDSSVDIGTGSQSLTDKSQNGNESFFPKLKETVFYFAFDSDMNSLSLSKSCAGVFPLNMRRGVLHDFAIFLCEDNTLCLKKTQAYGSELMQSGDGVHGVIYEYAKEDFDKLFRGLNRQKSLGLERALAIGSCKKSGEENTEDECSVLRKVEAVVYSADRSHQDGVDCVVNCLAFDYSAVPESDSLKKKKLSSDYGSAVVRGAMVANLQGKYRQRLLEFVKRQTAIGETQSSALTVDTDVDACDVGVDVATDSAKTAEVTEYRRESDGSVPYELVRRKDVAICNGYVLRLNSAMFHTPEWGFAADITLRIAAEAFDTDLHNVASIKNMSANQSAYIERFIDECKNDSEFASVIGVLKQ